MQIDVPNYERGCIDQGEVPDEPIREFVSWLMRANRYRLEQNPDLTLEKVGKLRAVLQAALRQTETAPSPPKKKAVAR